MSQLKEKVLIFFINKGKVYTNQVLIGAIIRANYIVGALRKLLKAPCPIKCMTYCLVQSHKFTSSWAKRASI
jgi:hypothetical protein